MVRDGYTIYTGVDYDSGLETEVTIYQVEGLTTGTQVLKRHILTHEERKNRSITAVTQDSTSKKTYYFLARTESSDYSHVFGDVRTSFENFIIREDLTHFGQRKEFLDSIIQEGRDLNLYTSSWELDYYKELTNDLFYGFFGDYTGNAIVIFEEGTFLIVRTSDQGFNYYTEIDLTGTNPFQGANPCSLEDEERDANYFQGIRKSSKEPKFKTKTVNGEEVLVPKNGSVLEIEEVEEFKKFKDLYLESFDDLSKIKVGKLLQKK